MGLFDKLKKPDPQVVSQKLKEAIAQSDALIAKGDKENALNVLLEYKDLGRNDADYCLHIAYACYYAGKNPEAVEYNKRGLELNPDNGRAYINMGRAYFAMSKYDEAASAYAQAIRLIEEKPECNQRSDYGIACAWYGASLVMAGKKEEGESFIKKAEAAGYQKGNDIRKMVGLSVGTSPETPRMREIYQELANIIYSTIPEEWSTVYLYGEVLSDSRTSYFFYRRPSDNELIYSHDIPKNYNVDNRIYDKNLLSLMHCLADLNKEYAANFEKAWTNLTFVLEKNGKFNIKYSYEDVLNTGFNSLQRQKIWMYEVLGKEPEKEEDKALIQRYLDSGKNK